MRCGCAGDLPAAPRRLAASEGALDILYLLIPLSVVLVFAIGAVFWYALRSGQFDDLEGPGFEVLLDDDTPADKPKQ